VSRRSIPDLLDVPAEQHDLPWLLESLQWAIELEFSTIPIYLSGMWSIIQPGEVYYIIKSVVMEEMLHMGLACNMLVAVGGTPKITAPTFPARGLTGGVRPDLCVYLEGLNHRTVEMYMQIEEPEHRVAAATATESFHTIGEFYDAIAAAFTGLGPSISTAGQLTATLPVPDPSQPDHQPSPPIINEALTQLGTLEQVQQAIATIKDQGEGTSSSPDDNEGDLAHYYRFGEIKHGRELVQAPDGSRQWLGPEVPFPPCYPVQQVPSGGYPQVSAVVDFDRQHAQLITNLERAWNGGGVGSRRCDQRHGRPRWPRSEHRPATGAWYRSSAQLRPRLHPARLVWRSDDEQLDLLRLLTGGICHGQLQDGHSPAVHHHGHTAHG
jgi:hypothetical protein